MRQILTLTLFLITFLSNGQRTITGKVLYDDLSPAFETKIFNDDNLQLGTTNSNGDFKIELPNGTDEIQFGLIGMERASIKIFPNCDHIEIIMISDGTYHYRSHKKVDRIRKSPFDKIPELHSQAFKNGLFKYDTPCYLREFKPYKPQLDEIRKEHRIKRKQIKRSFKKLEIGDTIRVPFSGTYRHDGTDRTTLNAWAYFTDEINFKCIIKGVIISKDRRKTGYNLEIKVTDCNSCKYDSTIIYEKKDMVVGAVFRHNMRHLKVLTE